MRRYIPFLGCLTLFVGCATKPEETTAPKSAESAPPAAPPTLVSFSPSSGSGMTALFTQTFSSAAGAKEVLSTQVLVNNSFVTRNACFFGYDRNRNQFLLLKDNGDAWLPNGVTPGAGTVENGQCALLGEGSSVKANGNELNLTYNIRFKKDFAGSKTIWSNAYSAITGNGSPWVSKVGDTDLKWIVN